MDKSQWVKDKQLGLALLAAPVVWLGLYLFDVRDVSFSWLFDALGLFFILVLLRPILEEIVFRGLLQGWLLNQQRFVSTLWGISYANMLTSAVFASLHVFSHSWWMAMAVFVPSLIFGYFRDRYQGFLLPSIILHCCYNAGYFILYPPE